jgi:hypothetical protein
MLQILDRLIILFIELCRETARISISILFMNPSVIKIEFPAADLDGTLASVYLLRHLLMLYGGIPLLMNIFHEIFLAEFIQLCHVFLHADSFEHLVLLCEELLLQLLSLLHLHELANFTFLDYQEFLRWQIMGLR